MKDTLGIQRESMDDLLKAAGQPRDEKGKFLPKRPLEFTWPHFWLEVAEVTIAILIAQIIIEGVTWLIKNPLILKTVLQ